MFTTADQLNDIRANSRVLTKLIIGGAQLGALLTFCGFLLLLPTQLQQQISVGYALSYNVARLPPPINNWLAPGYDVVRYQMQDQAPEVGQYLDALPERAAWGAGVGSVALPILIAALFGIARRNANTPQAKGDERGGIGRYL